MDVNNLIAQAADAADYEDQTIDTGGTYDNEPAAAGFTPARFIGYVEVGRRPQKPYQGKDKPPCDEVRAYFELNGPKHQKEYVQDGVTLTRTNVISVKMAKKTGDKASFAKLFKKMVQGRAGIRHMAQMLGEGFLINIIHNVEAAPPAAGAKPKTYANMKDVDGNWLIQAPSVTDPITNDVRVVPVPEPTHPIKLLLWMNPNAEQWASIFIDGTREVKDAKGAVTIESKNWLQEDIVKNALNFDGSALQIMLGGLGNLTLEQEKPADKPADPPADKPADKQAEPDDVLASLGLV